MFKKLAATDKTDWMHRKGTIAEAFPVKNPSKTPNLSISQKIESEAFTISGDLVTISEHFHEDKKASPFENTGIFMGGKVFTAKTVPDYDGERRVLGDVLQKAEVDESFFIPLDDVPKWEYLKGPKKETRRAKSGFTYDYKEGGMIFPDALNNASRTIITGEGGKSPSRFKHVVQTSKGPRRLTPLELERLNMFPDRHTELKGISDTKRAFFMGNALVVGVVEKLGSTLFSKI